MCAGLIPAGAGSTGSWLFPAYRGWAHPRRRGEHVRRPGPPPHRRGSSPQARGALLHPIAVADHARLIPAGAGSTQGPVPASSTSRAHPRRRGEHRWHNHQRDPAEGSSPQARGAHLWGPWVWDVYGRFPAGAGSTLRRSVRCRSGGALPRRRGEHWTSSRTGRGAGGSSPQARGAHTRPDPALCGVRLIPAGAGSTFVRTRPAPWPRAHPRRRGEHDWSTPFCSASHGSSPQARGAHFVTRGYLPLTTRSSSTWAVPFSQLSATKSSPSSRLAPPWLQPRS